METTNLLITAVAVIILLPAVLAGGWVVAAALLALWLFVTKVLPEVWDLVKMRQFGVSAGKLDDDRKTKQDIWNRGEE